MGDNDLWMDKINHGYGGSATATAEPVFAVESGQWMVLLRLLTADGTEIKLLLDHDDAITLADAIRAAAT